MKKRNSDVRHYEAVDPNPITMPVKFQKPPTLAEQIARYMSAHNRYNQQQGEETPEEADDFDVDDEDSPESPHELVFDALLNREIPRYEKALLDRGRAKFDQALQDKIRADKAAAEAARRARAALEAQGGRANKQLELPPEESDPEE